MSKEKKYVDTYGEGLEQSCERLLKIKLLLVSSTMLG